MNLKIIDLTGLRFGRLTAVKHMGKDKSGKNTLWFCTCDCGGCTTTTTTKLRSGHTKSCGCLKLECGKATRFPQKHGLRSTRLYRIWCGMKSRCHNPNAPKYHLYGGRGIKVCDEWFSNFLAFYDWANLNGYSDDLSIDRIDCDGNYEPCNCRWATITEQNRNRRSCKK